MKKVYIINPFNLSKVTDEAICEQIDEIISKYEPDADIPSVVADNIEIGSSILELEGELIARFTSRYYSKKLDNDKGEALEMHRLRTQWSKENTEKAPAIKYFEAKATEKYQLSREEEYKLLENLTRFKYSYQSLESKTNAWKKKLEAMKYDLSGRM